jgi:hypothetical protein
MPENSKWRPKSNHIDLQMAAFGIDLIHVFVILKWHLLKVKTFFLHSE